MEGTKANMVAECVCQTVGSSTEGLLLAFAYLSADFAGAGPPKKSQEFTKLPNNPELDCRYVLTIGGVESRCADV